MNYLVIMAGGSGTRLWPLSRNGAPKQLLPLIAGKSLLRIAFERAMKIVPVSQILVCVGAAYQAEMRDLLPELDAANLLAEPCGRDSLNAVAWATAVLADRDPDAVVGFFTADQLIEPESELRDQVLRGFEIVQADSKVFVTFGVIPTSPHTGYGYLHRGELRSDGSYRVLEFKEKPDQETASRYLSTGDYWWNSGMFIWRADSFLTQLRRFQPQNADGIARIVADPNSLGEEFPKLPKISVDYGVMEPVSTGGEDVEIVALPLLISWRDIGGYASLAEIFTTDESGNAISGLFVAIDSQNNLIISTDGSLTTMVGISDTVVVRTSEITLVCPIAESERIKQLVAEVKAKMGTEYA